MPLFTPIGGGGIGKATVSATTGSPTVDTTSRPGKTIYKFLSGTGSITIDTPGTAEILVVAGGGAGGGNCGGWGGGGGAGGLVYNASAFLPAGTLTVTVGVGGTGSTYTQQNGEASRLGDYYAVGGGAGGVGPYSYFQTQHGDGLRGGSGGGALGGAQYGFSGGPGTPGQGNAGAASSGSFSGGGGGSGGAASGITAGVGTANSITGTSVTYAAGGPGKTGGGAGANAAANTGNGGQGSWDSGQPGGNGGSGIVIVVIG